ncbi:MAG: PDZ domain-containing protein [Gammaproteobacteria bacterium]|nr:PDZ domain-containing protein [Gammaproteobacteria bacterium]MBT8443285.1 PDZ domain-containing protein [Gammaproteobacteria bacterium]NND36120.1 PDZ domain-containing protein [Gammaproteobacteria bacterium]
MPLFGLAQTGDAPAERAALGINIANRSDHTGPVEGVVVVGVTPGGAAATAGLRADDVLISIGDTSLMSESLQEANERLLQFMDRVKPGESIEVVYLRGGKVLDTNVVADSFNSGMLPPDFPFREDLERLGRQFESEFIQPLQSRWRHSGVFAGMELVALTPELGRYFGTEEGMLVVRAPDNAAIDLQDGDVIQTIGARVPKDPGHAMRILRSYEAGEELVIGIMRDERSTEIRLVLPQPEERTGFDLEQLFESAEKLVSDAGSR